jgi:hypothetical protein
VAQGVVGDLGECPGKFHPSWPRADDHKSQPAAATVGIGLALGGFERVENLMPDAS